MISMAKPRQVRLLAVALLCLAGFLSACGASIAIPGTQPEPNQPAIPTAAPTSEPVTTLTQEPTAPGSAPGFEANCRQEGAETYLEPQNLFCFNYPTGYSLQTYDYNAEGLVGPALDQSVEPLRVQLGIMTTLLPESSTLTHQVDIFLKDYASQAVVPAIERKPITLGNEPGELVEVVPGQRGSHHIFVIHNNLLVHLMFQPSMRDYPAARPEEEKLLSMVVASFRFK